jgi:hypothetical protein
VVEDDLMELETVGADEVMESDTVEEEELVEPEVVEEDMDTGMVHLENLTQLNSFTVRHPCYCKR